ncbi:uncharacterized protein FOMMEDRAFT_148560 [Fomitiporia mediterranea MF3/22]|uniref:uncharacterized protein n=1 Tax=Fomitiporia mediterranea (strain MF3/22) TaxID=694068 RepID=UPI00044082F5|nr:uncharacterized protein FOMMEDRAFT_148560 [Fomitiporia mediterranea MF3/22]EJC99676.1 hypothetical protein FOMMEDRAFT_148560 [Fomitiporia mediterranea MF3/22]
MAHLLNVRDVIANYKNKERISIAVNRLNIRATRDRTGRETHRGLEYIWYWTWDIVINRITCRYVSLSKIPQPRIMRIFEVRDEEHSKTRVPDIGIVRHLDEEVIEVGGEEFFFPAKSKLVAIGEIKPAPRDPSMRMVKFAISEATTALMLQAGSFFLAFPQRKAIVGISVAGDYWSFRTLLRTDFENDADIDDPDPDYLPSDLLSSLSPDPMDISNQSTPGPLDIIGSDEEFEYPIYQLQTPESDTAIHRLVDAIKSLENLEDSAEFSRRPL